MKRRFLFLLPLLAFLFSACSGLTKSAESSSDSAKTEQESGEPASQTDKPETVPSEDSETKETPNPSQPAENPNQSGKKEDSGQTSPTLPAETEQKDTEKESSGEQKQEEPEVELPNKITISENDYELKQIHKGGEEGNHYVIVFMGDGFTEADWDKREDRFRTFYGHIDLVKAVLFGETIDAGNFEGLEPFKSYRNYIDIYAIATVSRSRTDTYLKNTGMGFSEEGEQKVRLLLEKLKEQHGVSPDVMHTLINSSLQSSYGRAFFKERSFSNTVNANATIHEMCHSIGGLGDEKGNPMAAANLPNITTMENVPWKPVIGFSNIGSPVKANKVYIPANKPYNSAASGDCIMGLDTDIGHLCEVCKYAAAVRMSSVIKNTSIEMYDESGFEKVVSYDTYSALKEHLRLKGKQDNLERLSDGGYRIFSPGVSENKYYDANKTGSGDSQLCWAAVSSNLIAWWQDLYKESGKGFDNSLPQTEKEIFEKFKSVWSDKEGTFADGVLWYMSGAASGPGTGEYLIEYIDTSKWRYPKITAYSRYENNEFASLENFSKAVIDGLENGAVALGIADRNYSSRNGSAGHAVTVFGAEYDSQTNLIGAVWVADSDDNFRGLKKYSVSQKNGYVGIDYSIYRDYDRIKNALVLYGP